MKLEQAIEILKEWVEVDRLMRDFTEPISGYDGYCETRNIAIETVLKEVEVSYGRSKM